MKASGSKGKGGHIRSLHIKLPADHPVFSFPEGERSRVAREWLEQGRQMLAVMEEIRRDIAEIKKNLNRGERIEDTRDSSDGQKRSIQKNSINPAVFLDI